MNLKQNCKTAFLEIEKVRDFLINKQAIEAPPREIVQAHTRCSGWYSFLCTKEAECIAVKASWWGTHRDEHKSDASTERAWERTELGVLQSRIHLEKKGLERLINTFSRLVDNSNNEARNQT